MNLRTQDTHDEEPLSLRFESKPDFMDFDRPKKRKTGVKYPNASKRQNERFRAKWDAGKYDFKASGIPKP